MEFRAASLLTFQLPLGGQIGLVFESVPAIHGLAGLSGLDVQNAAGMVNVQVGHSLGRANQYGRRHQSSICFIRAFDERIQPARLEHDIIVDEGDIVRTHVRQRHIAGIIGGEVSVPADIGMSPSLDFMFQDRRDLARGSAIDIDHLERRIGRLEAGRQRHLRLFEPFSRRHNNRDAGTWRCLFSVGHL